METSKAILARRSIRKFKEDKVDERILRHLVQMAMAAPSACNKRPWFYYVVTNQEIINLLKKASRYSEYDAPAIIVPCGNKKRFLSQTKENDFWIQDLSASIENILLEATSLGLGSVWCGVFPMISPQKRVREILSIEENLIPLGMIFLGYPDEEKEERTQFDSSLVKYIR